jgi:hypothetical protein
MHHIKLNVDFGWKGECATAFHLMSFTNNLLFKQIIFSETIGQVAVRLSQESFHTSKSCII